MPTKEELVAEFMVRQHLFTRVSKIVAGRVKSKLDAIGIEATTSWRVKDPWSLATKLFIKERRGIPYASLAEIPDLAGVRVIAKHVYDLEESRVTIRDLFPGANEDDKSASLDPETFRYRGVHFEVHPLFGPNDLQGLGCEVQLRTSAEHLWSDLSHQLFYKTPGPISDKLLRRFNRLIALIELFDAEVGGTMDELVKDPSSKSRQILAVLESQFKSMVPRVTGLNRDLSLEVISSLWNLAPLQEEICDFASKFDAFVLKNTEKLKIVYSRLVDSPGQNPFYMQPESLLLWYLMETSKHDIADEWMDHHWDVALLEDLSIEWGVSLPE
jgi:ppGpp synthetase/RelA/SpoT-type nucleotidyltranferase